MHIAYLRASKARGVGSHQGRAVAWLERSVRQVGPGYCRGPVELCWTIGANHIEDHSAEVQERHLYIRQARQGRRGWTLEYMWVYIYIYSYIYRDRYYLCLYANAYAYIYICVCVDIYASEVYRSIWNVSNRMKLFESARSCWDPVKSSMRPHGWIANYTRFCTSAYLGLTLRLEYRHISPKRMGSQNSANRRRCPGRILNMQWVPYSPKALPKAPPRESNAPLITKLLL